jgi:hypothetical protein
MSAMLIGDIENMRRYVLNYFVYLGNILPLERDMLELVKTAIREAKRSLNENYT